MALSPALRSMVSSSKNKYKNNNGRTTKPKDGRNTYRFLAPSPEQASWVPETGQFWADLGVHWIKADENGKPIAVVGDCEIVHGVPSSINTAIAMAIESAHDEDSKKLYESWRPRKSVIINAIDRSQGDTVVQLELTPTTFAKFLELFELYADSGQDITDVQNGIDIVITKSGKGLNTEYDVAAAPGVSKQVTPDQLADAQDLPAFIEANYFRGEEQKALTAIQQVAGIAVPALGASGVTTPTAALTSSAATVADAPAPAAEPTPEPAPQPTQAAPVAEQPAPAPTAEPEVPASGLSTADEDALLKELDELANL